MRTDRFWFRALPLAVLLLGGATAPAVAEPLAFLRSIPFAPFLQGEADDDGGKVLTGDHTVAAGEEVEDIVVIDGTLTVEGTVLGDAVVVGGDLFLESGGSVSGDAVVTGGQIVDHGGRVRGEMRVVNGTDEVRAGASAAAIAKGHNAANNARAEVMSARNAARDGARESARDRRDDSWFGPIGRGFGDLVSALALGLVLAGIGSVLTFYGRPYLETVSDTVRTSTVRAGAVGLAAGFLIIPAFVVLLVALAVSIVGIPLLILAVPLYPLALAGAVGMGLLATAHAIGERTAEQRHEAFELRYRNSYSYLFTGLGMLLTPLVIAGLLKMTGFLGFLGTFLQVITALVIWLAATVGFGAVILSRAGTRRSFVMPTMEPGYDPDPLFDEPSTESPHV